MMKTKLTLFVTVLAAPLFGVGCASTPETSPPLVKPETSPPLVKIEPAFVKDGLAAYYPFNGNAKDKSGKGNDGDVKGATLAEDRHGKADSAYSFDGVDDYIQIRHKKGLKNINAFTVSLWLKADQKQLGSGGGWSAIINWWEGHYDRPDLKFSFWLGIKRVGIKDGHAFDAFVAPNSSGNPLIRNALETTVWVHIVYSHGSPGATLSFDGKQVQMNKNAPVKFPELNVPLLIGATCREPSVYQQQFSGSIDDVRIYNRALSAEEVKALYDLEKPKVE